MKPPSHPTEKIVQVLSFQRDLKTALSISTKDLMNHCRIKKKYCSFVTSELLKNKRKHHYKLPLSRSVSWREADMIGNEQFIEIENIQKVHQPHHDKTKQSQL